MNKNSNAKSHGQINAMRGGRHSFGGGNISFTENGKDRPSFKAVYKRLYNFMKPYRLFLIGSLILIIISSFLVSLGPLLLGKATDKMYFIIKAGSPNYESFSEFLKIVYIMAAVYFAGFVIKYLSSKLLLKVSQSTLFDLRNTVDEKFKKLPLKYIDSNEYGDILSRITNDVDTISNSLQQSLEQVVGAMTTVIFILVLMIMISPLLTVVSLITIPLTMFVTMKVMRLSQKYFDRQQKAIGALNGYVEEMYTGHTIVSAFGMEEEVKSVFDDKNEELYSTGKKAQFLSSTMMPLAQGMNDIGFVAVVFVGAMMVIGGSASIGTIQAFIQYLKQFSQPIMQTAQIMGIMQSTLSASNRVFEFLDEEEEVSDENGIDDLKLDTLDVEFDSVKFAYSDENTLMKNVNFKVDQGQMIAIVGPTGAGKTTLVNLLLRFYDISEGSIKIGGVDIRDIRRKDLRKLFGMVLQDSWIFTGSIIENIRYGRLDATDEDVVRAAKAARADEFIERLPGGYNFKLYEGGTNIAQGERQLITIARAILSNSPIMILDEATSSVDTRTEVLIQEAMGRLMENKMSFVIAHRLSTIKGADKIMYMENGDIKEIGSHEELLEKNGKYASLYRSQFEGEENEV